jgi:hypothetical protein
MWSGSSRHHAYVRKGLLASRVLASLMLTLVVRLVLVQIICEPDHRVRLHAWDGP